MAGTRNGQQHNVTTDAFMRERGNPYADPANWAPGLANPYKPFHQQPFLDIPGISPFRADGSLRLHAYSLENLVRPASRPTKPLSVIPEKR